MKSFDVPKFCMSGKRKFSASGHERRRVRQAGDPATRGHVSISATPSSRLRELATIYENSASNFLIDSVKEIDGKLKCTACNCFLDIARRDSINSHVAGPQHEINVRRQQTSSIRQAEITRYVSDNIRPSTTALPEHVKLYNITRSLLGSGIPLLKADSPFIRNMFYVMGQQTLNSTTLSTYIPAVNTECKLDALNLLGSHEYSLMFDGTSKKSDVASIILRTVQEDGPKNLMVAMRFSSEFYNGDSLADMLLRTLSHYNNATIDPYKCIGIVCDGASVNSCAIRNCGVSFRGCIDIVCVAHTINNVAACIFHRMISDFWSCYCESMITRWNVKLVWKEQGYEAILGYSVVRWFSKYECLKQALRLIQDGSLMRFIYHDDSARYFATGNGRTLKEMLEKEEFKVPLTLALCAFVDFGEFLSSINKFSQGDSLTVFSMGMKLDSLKIWANSPPRARYEEASRGTGLRDKAINDKAIDFMVKPAVDYANSHYFDDNAKYKQEFMFFNMCKYFHPWYIKTFNVCVADLTSTVGQFHAAYKCTRLLSQELLNDLNMECLEYIARCNASRLLETMDILAWFKENKESLVAFHQVANRIATIPTSSAAVERSFSLLSNSFGPRQDSALGDMMEAAVMLQFNNPDDQATGAEAQDLI